MTPTRHTSTGHEAGYAQARTRREVGIVRSTLGADRAHDAWPDAAFAHLCMYAARRRKAFTIEEFREDAEKAGLPHPPDGRAYGGVTTRALRVGVIRPVGWALAKSSNLSPKRTYASGVGSTRPLKLRRKRTGRLPRAGVTP